MAAKEFTPFRLVGGTALSLLRGHRESIDIDLFSDAPYDSIDFGAIYEFLCNTFSYVDTNEYKVVGLGKSYYIGNSEEDCVKLDLFYTDKFIQEFILIDGIRLATVEEIIAMKIDVISRVGRKKDFWDIHELKLDYWDKFNIQFHCHPAFVFFRLCITESGMKRWGVRSYFPFNRVENLMRVTTFN